jgi:hypothetical protein
MPADACFYDCFAGTACCFGLPVLKPLLVGGLFSGCSSGRRWCIFPASAHHDAAVDSLRALCVVRRVVYISRTQVGIAAVLLFWLWLYTQIGKGDEPYSAISVDTNVLDETRAAKKAEFTPRCESAWRSRFESIIIGPRRLRTRKSS